MKIYLTSEQVLELHHWIAQSDPMYGELRRLMLAHWGFAVTSQAISYHRHKYADLIAALRKQYAAQTRRRNLDRLRKQISRAKKSNDPDCA